MCFDWDQTLGGPSERRTRARACWRLRGKSEELAWGWVGAGRRGWWRGPTGGSRGAAVLGEDVQRDAAAHASCSRPPAPARAGQHPASFPQQPLCGLCPEPIGHGRPARHPRPALGWLSCFVHFRCLRPVSAVVDHVTGTDEAQARHRKHEAGAASELARGASGAVPGASLALTLTLLPELGLEEEAAAEAGPVRPRPGPRWPDPALPRQNPSVFHASYPWLRAPRHPGVGERAAGGTHGASPDTQPGSGQCLARVRDSEKSC